MILITHTDINTIKDAYVKRILGDIQKRVDSLEEIFSFIKSTNAIFESQVSVKLLQYKGAVKILIENATITKNTNANQLTTIINNERGNALLLTRINFLENLLLSLNNKTDLTNLLSAPALSLELEQTIFRNSISNSTDSIVKYLFNYEAYKESINPIAEDLSITVCPYCNRNFITHVEGKGKKRIIGPTFDHFYNKSDNILLSLSFYNLIPSCYICNSNLKSKRKFKLEFNLHPYIDEFGDDVTFKFDITKRKSHASSLIKFKPIIEIKNGIDVKKEKKLRKQRNEKDSGNIDVFKLDYIYESHYDTVEEIYNKFDKNNPYYKASIAEQLKLIGTNEAEFYRYHFGNYFIKEDLNKRPLAKLTKDVYEYLKSIESTL